MTPKLREAIIKAATQHAYQALDTASVAALTELERLYGSTATLLQQQIARYSNDGYFVSHYLKPFISYLDKHLSALKRQRNQLLEESLIHSAQVGIQPAAALGTGDLSHSVSASVKAVWDFQQASDNLHLSERIWRVDRAAQEGIAQAIRQAVAQGQNPMQAARELLKTGKGLPTDLLEKIKVLQTTSLQAAIENILLSGSNNALYNVQRLFKTEMTRANAIAYVKSNEQVPGLKGFKFTLSPRHRREDICDRLAAADDYGLGKGVYPTDIIATLYPAHPNTTSYIVAVFA